MFNARHFEKAYALSHDCRVTSETMAGWLVLRHINASWLILGLSQCVFQIIIIIIIIIHSKLYCFKQVLADHKVKFKERHCWGTEKKKRGTLLSVCLVQSPMD